MNTTNDCIFSIDVEDWFHIMDLPSTPPLSKWASLPSHVEKNFIHLLDVLDRYGVRATCFFLGWVAEKFPELVIEAKKRGHEIASHGYAHELVYTLSKAIFMQDIRKSKDILEDIINAPVLGYRAPGFSVTDDVPWFFDCLLEAGFSYSSSVFPGARGHGGMSDAALVPFEVSNDHGRLIEYPITLANVFNKRICFFGGGYLRLFPYSVIKKMTKQVIAEKRPVIYYLHPREIDPNHPRLEMGYGRRFKSYVNLATTEKKICRLFDDFSMTTFEAHLNATQTTSNHQMRMEAA